VQASNNSKSARQMSELLEEKENVIEMLYQKLEEDSDKIQQLSDQVQEAKANYSTKAEQQTTTAADIKKLHHAIQQQGEVANKKISAIEQKYQTLRKINLALEKRCSQLCAEIESLRTTAQQEQEVRSAPGTPTKNK